MRKYNAKGCFYLVADLIGTKKLLWTDYIETVVRNAEKGNFKFIYKGEEIYYNLSTEALYEKAMKDIKAKLRSIPDKEKNEHVRQFQNNKADNIPREFSFASWEQIKHLDRNILETGSHTSTHPNCENLTTDDEFENELKNSKNKLEKMLGYEISHFAYPAGSFNDKVINNVIKFGYKSALSVIPGFNDRNTDLYKLKRITVYEDFLLFKASVSGSHLFIQQILKKFSEFK